MDRRRKWRVTALLPVCIWGVDAKAQPFMQLARVRNISAGGALVEGMLRQIKPGQVIHMQSGNDQAQFRVVWVGKAGTSREGELGVESLVSEPCIWNVNLARCSEFVGKG